MSFFVAGNRIEDDILRQIYMNSNLRNAKDDLDLSLSKIGDSHCEVIAEKLKSCSTIRTVNLSCKTSSAITKVSIDYSQGIKSAHLARISFSRLLHLEPQSKRFSWVVIKTEEKECIPLELV